MKILIVTAALILSSLCYSYESYIPDSNPYIQSNTTTIRHSNGTQTYIQSYGPNSGCIRYNDGTTDYYSR